MIRGRRLGLIERIILIAGMIAGGAAISGCEEDLAYLGASGMGMGAKTTQQAQAWEVVGGVASEAGRRKHEENVAEKGQINIYGVGDTKSSYERRLEAAAEQNRRVEGEQR